MAPRKISTFAAVVFVTLTAADAGAADFKPVMQSSTAQGDVYWWSAKGTGSTLPGLFTLRYGFSRNVFLDVEAGLAASINGPGDTSRLGLANPTIGAHYADTIGKLTWFVGGRAAVPLGAVNNNDWHIATALAADSMAWWDLHLWAGYKLPVGAIGGIEYRIADPLVMRAELDPIFLFPVNTPAGQKGKVDFAYQGRFEIEARSGAGFGGGGAIQFVHIPTQDNNNFQSALEPFFSYDNGGFFMRAGVLCALNDPLGFCTDTHKVLSLHAMFGGHLD